MPEWLRKIWERCTARFTGALVIRFLDGKPVKVEVEEHMRPDDIK